MAEEAYLSREEVIKLLKVGETKLDDLIKQGKFKPSGEGKFKEEDIVNYMAEESPEPSLLTPEAEKPSEEGKVLPLGEAEPIRIEPKETKPLEETTEIKEEERPEETIEIIEPEEDAKEELKEEPSIPPDKPAKAEVAPPKEVEKQMKSSPLFSFLFMLSLLFILAAIGILLLPILKVPIPSFLKPALQFANKIF